MSAPRNGPVDFPQVEIGQTVEIERIDRTGHDNLPGVVSKRGHRWITVDLGSWPHERRFDRWNGVEEGGGSWRLRTPEVVDYRTRRDHALDTVTTAGLRFAGYGTTTAYSFTLAQLEAIAAIVRGES